VGECESDVLLRCRWVREDLQRKAASEQHVIADEPVCYRPLFLYTVKVSQVPAYDFTCDHDYYDYYYESDSEYNNYDDGPAPATNNESIAEY